MRWVSRLAVNLREEVSNRSPDNRDEFKTYGCETITCNHKETTNKQL
jgi:hypothetical protein